MMRSRSTLLLVMACAVLAGCAPATLTGSGATTRTLLASQVLPPQPHAETGHDGTAAVAALANYQRSYATPTAQADSPTFGGKK